MLVCFCLVSSSGERAHVEVEYVVMFLFGSRDGQHVCCLVQWHESREKKTNVFLSKHLKFYRFG